MSSLASMPHHAKLSQLKLMQAQSPRAAGLCTRGPATWPLLYNKARRTGHCDGLNQSPIDIHTASVRAEKIVRPPI